jgi:hypothetical protein
MIQISLRKTQSFFFEETMVPPGIVHVIARSSLLLVSNYESLLKLGNEAYEKAVGFNQRACQYSAAHVVSTLNASLPSDRVQWTPKSLASFISAFANPLKEQSADHDITVVWLYQPREIVGLLLRGTNANGDSRSGLAAMLEEECEDVRQSLQYVHKYIRSVAHDATANEAIVGEDNNREPSDNIGEDPGDDTDEEESAGSDGAKVRSRLGFAALSIALRPLLPILAVTQGTAGFVRAARSKLAAKKKEELQRYVATIHAKSLIDGGLSTGECRAILKLHDLRDSTIDAALAALS